MTTYLYIRRTTLYIDNSRNLVVRSVEGKTHQSTADEASNGDSLWKELASRTVEMCLEVCGLTMIQEKNRRPTRCQFTALYVPLHRPTPTVAPVMHIEVETGSLYCLNLLKVSSGGKQQKNYLREDKDGN